MPNKTEEYLALACKTADSFSRQWEHWAEFLMTAARLYKYSYPDQLMIYAQRPDATACAEYDVLRFIASEPKNALRDSVTEIITRKCYHIGARNTPITFQWRISI